MTENEQKSPLRKRATAVIVKGGKVLLMKRVKPGHEYYIFPGGGIKEGETPEGALKREVAEELTLSIVYSRFLFVVEYPQWPSYATSHTGKQRDSYFLVDQYEGVPEIGGPEKERMSEENQYHLEWFSIGALRELPNCLPDGSAKKVAEFLAPR